MNLSEITKNFESTKTEARTLHSRLTAQAAAEGRPLTAAEMASIQSLIDETKAWKARLDRAQGDVNMLSAIDQITAGTKPANGNGHARGLSLGAQFVNSDVYRWLKDTAIHARACEPRRWQNSA